MARLMTSLLSTTCPREGSLSRITERGGRGEGLLVKVVPQQEDNVILPGIYIYLSISFV